MIESLKVADFKAVPYLETSQLIKNHRKGILFSTDKPNVIVGPNGAGKSALMKALALHTLSYDIGTSNFDDHIVKGSDCDNYWSNESRWGTDFVYLKGFDCKSDFAPALYYRPGHIPGNDDSIAAAMMCGYFKEAKDYALLVDKKSSGQQSQSLLKKLLEHLSGKAKPLSFSYVNWSNGKEPKVIDRHRGWIGPWEHQAEVLKKTYGHAAQDARPVMLMDEPEQSLDARAEALLWKQIADANCRKLQIIVATHSLYPFMHPEKFNIIEAIPGYLEGVQSLI